MSPKAKRLVWFVVCVGLGLACVAERASAKRTAVEQHQFLSLFDKATDLESSARLGRGEALLVSVQCSEALWLILTDPVGRSCYFSEDSTSSAIPGCDAEEVSVTNLDDTTFVAGQTSWWPRGAHFYASRASFGRWHLEARLARSGKTPSRVWIDVNLISDGPFRGPYRSPEWVTLKPGKRATWSIDVAAGANVLRNRARVARAKTGERP